MELTAALPTFLITLREGVEAALVVGIVLACLQKAKATHLNSWVYAGIGGGVLASTLVGILLGRGVEAIALSYPQYAPVIKPLLETGFGVIAIAMLSWMLIWMTQQARSLKAEITGSVQSALNSENGTRNAGWGIFSLIFIAVLREGFEAVSLVLAYLSQGIAAAGGAIAGLACATLIGFLLFKWGVKINIGTFFQAMGIFLLLIVGGLVLSALAHLEIALKAAIALNPQLSGWCFGHSSCLLGSLVWNGSQILSDRTFPGIVLKALFGYREKLYLGQIASYLLFLTLVGGLYFRSLMAHASSVATQQPKKAL
ncbi:FTR1 family iron permease [Desertifilum sp. FACHB-1129]|uniref:Iron permease FTR1 n=1 Tax=Desertifilum tharense IPPAS B-1220 TaxID=1781255 RepID=A0A1E5QLD4_9CYAN|nr:MULTISPECIES: FTR1 family protein [Desertifilum]MDA0209764.1 FTR1 family iron permease [Cyanobacteria bacterium FC1]MBD2310745.1 FTR1 family iron permease [Desertifilum sp. FACHB-1129]MBD2320782.1 FTR1 family iron permease [Desertifilum sp. FACHB-866]MBD2330910.1 FTR1 family iron permease [Desertifilum sp. FACHB-868]OEJ75163.1 hypothetical protein BH720_10565 [Desertifilum tharense IPPAS B-1220]